MTLSSLPSEATPKRDMRDIERALAAFGLRLRAPAAPIGESVLNENFRVETDAGPIFSASSARSGRSSAC